MNLRSDAVQGVPVNWCLVRMQEACLAVAPSVLSASVAFSFRIFLPVLYSVL